MKNAIATAIAAIRARLGLGPTTDKALKGITAAVADLRKVAELESANIALESAAVDAARARLVEAHSRMNRAERIADRFEGLVA